MEDSNRVEYDREARLDVGDLDIQLSGELNKKK